MSLIVWLPLTKDLRQQGLSNIMVINSGAIYSSTAGKLGGAYTVGTSKKIGIDNAVTLGTTFSIAFWVKVNSWNQNWANIFKLYKDSYDYIGMCMSYTTRTQLGFHIYKNNGSNARTSVVDGYDNFTANEWHHITITVTPDKALLYKNGTVYRTTNISSTFPAVSNYSLYLGQSVIAGGLDCTINDFRLYDHCLSPMEVKELAKGLVLHYPLNRQGWGQENLMPGTYRADGNNTNKIYGWMNNGYGTPEIIMKDGNKCIHLQANCSNTTTPSIVSASKLLLENGVEYTVSCDLMYDKEIQVGNSTPIHYHNGSTNSTDPFNMTNVNNGKGFSWKSIKPVAGTIIPANTWQHYEMRLTALATPSDSSLPYSTYRAFIYGSVRTVSETTIVNMWLKNWKIEKGSIATPWCPNSSDVLATAMGLNSTTEYDCSGFCNNGTRTGTFSWTSDTPKYNVSQYFNGSSYILTDSGTFSWFDFNKCTVAVWMKPTTAPSSWAGTFGIAHNNASNNKSFVIGNYGGKFTVQSANGSWVNIQSSNLPINEWHYCVATLDGTDIKMYFDGELVKTYTTSWGSTTVASDTRIQVGNDLPGSDEIYQGYYSDARIYTTALSADDVRALYENSAYIDNSGNTYAATYTEV